MQSRLRKWAFYESPIGEVIICCLTEIWWHSLGPRTWSGYRDNAPRIHAPKMPCQGSTSPKNTSCVRRRSRTFCQSCNGIYTPVNSSGSNLSMRAENTRNSATFATVFSSGQTLRGVLTRRLDKPPPQPLVTPSQHPMSDHVAVRTAGSRSPT